MARHLCSTKFVAILLLLSAVPLAFIVSLEHLHPAGVYRYHSRGWMRESAKWDKHRHRFIVSLMEGGLAEIVVPENHSPSTILQETALVTDHTLGCFLGFAQDPDRNRVIVSIGDLKRNLHSSVAAYDSTTWNRLFLTQLSTENSGKTLADDVAIDDKGNSYITDVIGNKIWKIGVNGTLISTITSPIFTDRKWYRNFVGLNGIVFHPDGFLLVVHTSSGDLIKVELEEDEVVGVKIVMMANGSIPWGDGMELVSATRLVVAGLYPSGRMVESLDGWKTAMVVGTFWGPLHRISTAVTVKDGRVYLNHMLGFGFTSKKHAIVEAVF